MVILSIVVFYAITKEREELGCYRMSVGRQCDDEDSVYVKNTKMEVEDTCRDKKDRLKSIVSYHEKGGVWKRCVIISLVTVFTVYIIYRLQSNFQLYSYLSLFLINFTIIYFYHNYINYHHFRLLKRNAVEIIDSIPCDNGYITVTEIRKACAVDINNDGVISKDEKDRTSRVWIQTYFGSQDLNSDIILHKYFLRIYK